MYKITNDHISLNPSIVIIALKSYINQFKQASKQEKNQKDLHLILKKNRGGICAPKA